MKTKMLLMVALVGAATVSAQAGVRFGFSIGLPLPAPVIVTAPAAPVYVAAPAPVYVAPPVVFAPALAPVVVVPTPPCPGVGYVWNAGYYTSVGYNRVWIPGNWQYRPSHVGYVRGYDRDHGRDYRRW